jgi:hypothetical protein
MFSRSVNDTSRVIRMMIVGDATTWSVNSDDTRGVIYNHKIFYNIGYRYRYKKTFYALDSQMFLIS